MGLWSAAPFLVGASLKNRVRAQARRLKNPKYLVATAVGLFYLWSIFLRRLVMPGDRALPQLPAGGLMLVEAVMVVGALAALLFGWLLGSNRTALRFSEAEIQFFFAGPVSRRQLLHFKLLRMLAQTLASALITTLLFGRAISGHALFFVVGSFLALGSLGLHLTGASLTRESLAKHGRYGLLHRLLTLGAVVGVLGAVGWWAMQGRPPAPAGLDPREWISYLRQLYESGPMSWVLWPLLAPIRVALAPDAAHFLAALPGGLLVLAGHYLWVMSSDHAFEESAVQYSERWARRVEALRDGRRGAVLVARPFRLRLGAVGRPEVALLWKSLAGIRRLLRLGLLPAVLGFGLGAGMLAYSLLRGETASWLLGVAVACALLGVLVALAGPTAVPLDFRRDLPNLEILKTLPLSGRQVVLGELAGPFLVVVALQWFLWVLALLLALGPLPGVSLSTRLLATASAVVLGPGISAAGLVLINATVLLFPAWVSNEPRRGIEAMGQRMLTLAGGLILLALGILPAGIAGGGLFLLLGWLGMGLGGLLPAAVVASAVLFAECALCVVWMGRVFERLDPTE